MEVWANRNSFTGRPIETMGMERLSISERAAPYTSAVARAVGKAGVLSPVQIDHVIRGYLGWLGAFMISAADMAVRPGERTASSKDSRFTGISLWQPLSPRDRHRCGYTPPVEIVVSNLADLTKNQYLFVECNDCGRQHRFYPRQLLKVYGNISLESLGQRLTCGGCQSKHCAVRIVWAA